MHTKRNTGNYGIVIAISVHGQAALFIPLYNGMWAQRAEVFLIK